MSKLLCNVLEILGGDAPNAPPRLRAWYVIYTFRNFVNYKPQSR